MKKLEQKAYAKINLTLDIEGVRDDGFHNIKTVMQEVSLCDDIKLIETYGKGVSVRFFSNLPYLPTDDRNNAVRAAKWFYKAAGIFNVRLDIRAFKRIPVAGGLGGSSTNAACVLSMLSKMHPNKVGADKLKEIALSIGSDVPFFLDGKCMLAGGTGGELTRLPPMPDCIILIAKVGKGLSAGKMYKEFDEDTAVQTPTTDKMLEALENGELTDICGAVSNMLTRVAVKWDENITSLCDIMKKNGATCASMSGSGSAVFGIFKSKDAAEICERAIREQYPSAEIFIEKPLN